MRNLPEQIAAELGLPPHAFAVFSMPIGYPIWGKRNQHQTAPAEFNSAASRADSSTQRRKPVEGYNATMREFQREQGMKAIDWTQQCFNREGCPRRCAAATAFGRR